VLPRRPVKDHSTNQNTAVRAARVRNKATFGRSTKANSDSEIR